MSPQRRMTVEGLSIPGGKKAENPSFQGGRREEGQNLLEGKRIDGQSLLGKKRLGGQNQQGGRMTEGQSPQGEMGLGVLSLLGMRSQSIQDEKIKEEMIGDPTRDLKAGQNHPY